MSACRLSRRRMTIEPLRVVNLAPSSFGIFSISVDGSGIVAMLTVSPTLIAGALSRLRMARA